MIKTNVFKIIMVTNFTYNTDFTMEQNKLILIADPRILNIPIIENGEHLIDLTKQSEIAFGPSPEIPNNTDYTKLRISVYKKLLEAQKLLPKDLRFCIYEGYRSLKLQEKLFDMHYQQIKNLYSNWNNNQCFDETTKLVSPVINKDGSVNIPPHSTGAAFDLYLIDENNNIIDMGLLVKDWLTDKSGELSLTDSNKISSEAKSNRKIMQYALESVGFVNYPTEYWHWSYGDRYWAYNKKMKNAIYGKI